MGIPGRYGQLFRPKRSWVIWGANPNELFVAGQLGVIFHEVPSTVSVELDIKPQSCPNPLNTKSKGVLPVAVLALEVSM